MSRVTLDNITKQYGTDTAVDSLSVTVEDGETLGVIGPSGCGKTTTLRMIAGFETPTAGQIRFDDELMTHVAPEDRNVGLVFQSYALFDNMTVAANVAFGLKMQGKSKRERQSRANELLELLGIEALADRSPATLSGGQQQRVGLARALAIEPNILLLDEPMTGLDAQLKSRLESEVSSLLDELDITALYVTHDQEEAMRMCDRIAVLNDGQLRQLGRPAEIYNEPADPFVARFVGTTNLIPITVQDETATFESWSTTTERLPDGEWYAVVRPEDISYPGEDITGTVRNYAYIGDRVQAKVTLSTDNYVTVNLPPSTSVERGDTLPIDVNVDDLHVIERS